MATPDPSGLRRALKRARAAVPAPERRHAALAVRDALLAEPAVRRARRLGAYIAHGDELDLAPLLAALHAQGREVFLPRLLKRPGRMEFARHHPDLSLPRNRYGIPEPARDAPTVGARFLQVVLLPLVGFDAAGTRLGSGAGYYDRSFGFRHGRAAWHAPLLIGVGYACQEVPALEARPWDVPLDAVVTEVGLRRFARGPR
jgi:5-formyltetrahydrofolate cyclo-ligase